MSMALFVLLLPISSYVAALSFIREEWGLNNAQAGAVYSAYLVGYAFSALFIVPLTDRFRPQNILGVSAVLSVAAHLLFPLVAHNVVVGVVLRAVAGVGLVGVYMPGLRVIAERFSGAGRGAAIGLFVTAQYAANAGSLAITGALMATLDWREAYLVVSMLSVAGLPLAYLLLRSRRGQPAANSSGRLDLSVLQNRPVRYLILGYSAHALTLFAVRVWLPGFLLASLIARGDDPGKAAAWAATIAGLAMMIGSSGPVAGGLISDRWGRAMSASAIVSLSAACSFAIGWTGGLPFATIMGLGVVYGWAIAADSAIYSTGITEVASPTQLGSTMAVQAFIGLLSGVAGPIAFGALLDLSPGARQWEIAFTALGLISVVAIAGMQRLRALPQSRLLAKGKG
jgi:MFS family permease